MDDQNKPADPAPEAAMMAIPQFCPRDGDILVEGERFGYPAWVCPSCTYWKLKP